MSASGAHLLSKIMAVGLVGTLASMGLLLFTLNVARPVEEARGPETISRLAFEAHLARGEVLECTLQQGELRGLRQGADGTRISFRVAGEIPARLLERISLRQVPLRTRGKAREAGSASPPPRASAGSRPRS
jgi:hypothetical protein